MDHDDFRTILESSEVDIWTFMDTAIAVASADYGTELKHRRDGIVERLYATTSVPPQCPNCDADGPNGHNGNQPKAVSPYTPQSVGGDGGEEDEEELDPYAGLFDDEQKKILDIKKQLEDPYQSEDTLVELLQTLADMEISVQELKEADIGKHVSQLRKQHPSDVVRRLAKQIVNGVAQSHYMLIRPIGKFHDFISLCKINRTKEGIKTAHSNILASILLLPPPPLDSIFSAPSPPYVSFSIFPQI
ncbi:hypothetical protein C1H46_026883 [Malus baccata]|uniref:TFIIS N-terminal domain-containing protein n=1 Tax=Malus baccata TaxID=106549 RepID=A0A540LM75_MALBA|nr:hypothetical protein C1H46_026883 [Malus baccata]